MTIMPTNVEVKYAHGVFQNCTNVREVVLNFRKDTAFQLRGLSFCVFAKLKLVNDIDQVISF